MMHSQIENEQVVERYVRNQLTPEERQAFEEHFFSCDMCFEKLQEAERFRAGIREAASRGLLNDESRSTLVGALSTRLVWAFAATTCVALLCIAWMYLLLVPKLRGERDRAVAKLQAERQSRAVPERTLPVEQAEANVPLVMLQASRTEEEPASILLPPGSKNLVLWIEIGPSRYRAFRLEVLSPQNRLVTSVDHLVRGPYGALAASLPAAQLPTGDFLVKLTGQDPPPASVAGEYKLRVLRP